MSGAEVDTQSQTERAANEEQVTKKDKSGRWSELRYSLILAAKNPLVVLGSIMSVGSVLLAALSGLIVRPNLWKFVDSPIRLCWNNPEINWHIQSVFACPGNQVFALGTDSFGQDLLKMIILALPTDLEISFTIVHFIIRNWDLLGSLTAYAGKLVDEAILRVTDIFFAVPSLILAIVILSVIGRSLTWLTFAVLITWWPLYVRLVRSQILSEKEKPYAEALRAVGAGRLRILFLHILPNSIYPVLVQFTLDIGGVILVFSSLMFLGFSPNPLLPELGNLASAGISYVGTAPWLIIFPGFTILIIALGFNLLGDGIRDLLDPRLRR